MAWAIILGAILAPLAVELFLGAVDRMRLVQTVVACLQDLRDLARAGHDEDLAQRLLMSAGVRLLGASALLMVISVLTILVVAWPLAILNDSSHAAYLITSSVVALGYLAGRARLPSLLPRRSGSGKPLGD